MALLPRRLATVFLLSLLVPAAPAARTATAADDNLQDACNKTLFPKVCVQSLNANPETKTATPRRIAELSVYVAAEVGTTVAAFAHHSLAGVKDDALYRCLDSCSEDVEEAVAHLSALTRELTDAKFLEVKAWLSSTLGGTSTCEEACRDTPPSDVKNAAVMKSLEFEKLLRVTLELIAEASGTMNAAEVALPPATKATAGAPAYGSPYGAPSPFGGYGEPAGAPAYGAPAPAYGARRPRAPSPSKGGAKAPSPAKGGAKAPAPSPKGAAKPPSRGGSKKPPPAPPAGETDVEEEATA
ncbi:hypothetical protein ACP4OV_006975 [Aristida adscensionis]